MEPECPNLIHPRYYVDPATDEGYEGSYMCNLVDKYCLVEYGNECEEYNNYLKEVEIDELQRKTCGKVEKEGVNRSSI